MISKIKIMLYNLLLITVISCNNQESTEIKNDISEENKQSFAFDSTNFLLNGEPFQIISGEIHYSRVPKKYWRHRIQMAKAMGGMEFI